MTQSRRSRPRGASLAPWSTFLLALAVALALVAGLIGSAFLFSLMLRIRPDFGSALAEPRLLLKFAVTLSLAASAGCIRVSKKPMKSASAGTSR